MSANCYFLPKGIGYCSILKQVRDSNGHGACWPENSMSLAQQMTARPYTVDIITESPYIVGLYDRLNVFVWDSQYEAWVNPNFQTYGASISVLTMELFDNRVSIPMRVLSSISAEKFLIELKKSYNNLK